VGVGVGVDVSAGAGAGVGVDVGVDVGQCGTEAGIGLAIGMYGIGASFATKIVDDPARRLYCRSLPASQRRR
jgi:hypothetical protein